MGKAKLRADPKPGGRGDDQADKGPGLHGGPGAAVGTLLLLVAMAFALGTSGALWSSAEGRTHL